MTRLLGSVRALVRDRFCYLITQSRKTEANLLTERSREVMFPLLKRLYFCEPSSGRSSAGSIAADDSPQHEPPAPAGHPAVHRPAPLRQFGHSYFRGYLRGSSGRSSAGSIAARSCSASRGNGSRVIRPFIGRLHCGALRLLLPLVPAGSHPAVHRPAPLRRVPAVPLAGRSSGHPAVHRPAPLRR